jgi:hypothetical protein
MKMKYIVACMFAMSVGATAFAQDKSSNQDSSYENYDGTYRNGDGRNMNDDPSVRHTDKNQRNDRLNDQEWNNDASSKGNRTVPDIDQGDTVDLQSPDDASGRGRENQYDGSYQDYRQMNRNQNPEDADETGTSASSKKKMQRSRTSGGSPDDSRFLDDSSKNVKSSTDKTGSMKNSNSGNQKSKTYNKSKSSSAQPKKNSDGSYSKSSSSGKNTQGMEKDKTTTKPSTTKPGNKVDEGSTY